MKKILLFLSFLLMSIGVFGTEVTFTKSDFAGQGTANTGSEVTATKNGVTFTFSKGYCADESLRCYAHGALSITSETTIEKINFTTTGGKNGGLKTEVAVGATTYSVADLASQARFTQIVVTIETSYTITAQSNNNSYGTVSLSGNVITGSPNSGYRYADPAYTVSPINSATVAQNGNLFTVTPSSNCTITINFEKTPKYIVNWLVNTDTIYKDTVLYDSEVDSIPYIDINNYCDDAFVGWTNSEYEKSTPPDVLFTSIKPTITKDTTFYAVFGNYENGNLNSFFKTELNEITTSDVFIIVGEKDGEHYAMPNNNGTTSAPDGISVTPINNYILSPVSTILWNLIGNNTDGYTFYPNNDSTKWLYCSTKASSGSNNNLRVGDSERNTFVLNNDGYFETKDGYTKRYIGVYTDNPDWRSYTSVNSNIAGQTFEFYKATRTIDEYHTNTDCVRKFNNAQNDSLWTTKGNWTKNKIPTIKYGARIDTAVIIDTTHAVAKHVIINQNTGNGKIIIKPNKGLEVDSTIVVSKNNSYHPTTPNDLILESSESGNASLIFNNKNNNQATVCLYSKSYIDRDKNEWHWQYMGTAMTSLNALYNYYGSWVYRWDGEQQTWIAVPNGGTMNAWTGYCITQETTEWYATTGTLVKTDELDTTLTVPVGKDMVFANSWTAPIHISKLVESGFEMTPMNVYLFNTGYAPQSEGGSSEYTGEGEEAGTHIVIPIHAAPYLKDTLIAPQQGFFVSNAGGADDGFIRLNYKALVRGSDSIVAGPMRASKRNLESVGKPDVMKIYVNGSLYRDNVVILEREDFSTGFDNGWDGNKSSFGTLSPSIYVVNKNGTYDAVSAIPEFEETVLGFRPGNDSIYTLKFEYNGGRTLYLNDMVTLESTLIDNDSKYVFASNGSEEIRFIISSIPYSDVTTELNNIKTNSIKKLIINGNGYIIRNGLIFNILGQSIK